MINNMQEELVYIHNSGFCQLSKIGVFAEVVNESLPTVSYFRKKLFPSKMFDWVLNTALMTTALASDDCNTR